MVIDCEGCVMRDIACGDCVVTFLLGPEQELGSAERTALAVLADGGLVPPLRMHAHPHPRGSQPPGESRSRGARGVASA